MFVIILILFLQNRELTKINEECWASKTAEQTVSSAQKTATAYAALINTQQNEKDNDIVIINGNNVVVRDGPGDNYAFICYLVPDSQVKLIGRNYDSSWMNVELFDEDSCFIFSSDGKPDFDSPIQELPEQLWVSVFFIRDFPEDLNLPFIEPLPTPTSTSTLTKTPEPTSNPTILLTRTPTKQPTISSPIEPIEPTKYP